jgi:hypothetical protein
MSKKLLAESTVRRFMKLASIGAISDRFITENLEDEEINEMEAAYARDEEELEPEEPAMPGEADLEEPAPEMEEEPVPEMEEEPAAEGEMSLSDEEAALLVSLGERLAAAGAGEAEEELEPEMDMDDAPEEELEPEMDMDAAPEEEAPEDELMEDEDLENATVVTETEFDNLVNEIMKRVTKRILREKIKK